MPVPSRSDIEIAQRACTLAGVDKISNFVEPGNKVAEVLNDVYEDIVSDALTIHPWRFASRTEILGPPLSPPPRVQFSAAYALPNDPAPLQVRTVYVGGGVCSLYRLRGEQLHLNAQPTDAVELDALWRDNEMFWPPWFRLYAIARIATFLSLAVTRNGEVAAALGEEAEKQLARSRTRDSQQQTTTKLAYTKIRSARLGGRPL
jgi:hypothetical protein